MKGKAPSSQLGLVLSVLHAVEHAVLQLFLADASALAAGGQVQDQANDHPADEHDDGQLAHVHGVAGDEQQDEDHQGDDGGEVAHANAAGDLVGTLQVGLGLTQPDQGEGGQHPGQHEGCAGEEEYGVGEGRTKKAAEQEAAYISILKLHEKNIK